MNNKTSNLELQFGLNERSERTVRMELKHHFLKLYDSLKDKKMQV